MLYACVQRFDVMGNLENLAFWSGTKQALSSQGCYVNVNGQESELELAMGLK